MLPRPFVILAIAALVLDIAAAVARAQVPNATISPTPMLQFFDSSGRPAAGFCLSTYQAGTTTPLATYTDSTAATANANPTVLDVSGRAAIWLLPQAYKFVLRAKTTGCAVPGAVQYTVDNVADNGFGLLRQAKAGTFGIGITGAPATGTGGGVSVGNALLSATTAGLYVSVNGGAPALLVTAASAGPATPTSAVQFNNAGAFGGSANLVWDNGAYALTICNGPATGCTTTSGFRGPAFSSSATGTNPAFTTTGGTFQVFGNGDGQFQDLTVTSTFNSLATGTTSALQQSTGTFRILGNGDALFQDVSVTNTFNSLATGITSAIQQASGTFTITGAGDANFQSVKVTNALTALNAGAAITSTTATHGITETDTGGSCQIGTGLSGGISCSSDRRLKTGVRPLPDSLAGVLKLRPVTFEWERNHTPGIGFISQEVEPIFPALVTRGEDGYLMLSEIGLVPELVKAVQQLAAQVSALQGRRR
jgi:hypothetical protein